MGSTVIAQAMVDGALIIEYETDASSVQIKFVKSLQKKSHP